jgi:very-short-patch-repair endonuclease
MSVPWESLARGQHGVVGRHQLMQLKWSARQIDHLVASRRLVRIHPGVYGAPGAPWSFEHDAVAACLAHPQAALTAESAAQLWGFRRCPPSLTIRLVAPATAKITVTGASILRTRRFDGLEVVHRDDAISLTSPASTLVLMAHRLQPSALESIVEQCIEREWTTAGALVTLATRMAGPRSPGAHQLRHALTQRADWSDAVESDLELQVRRLLVQSGLPMPMVRHEIRVAGGVVLHPDFCWPDAHIALEVDHSYWHAGRVAVHRDHQRDRLLLGAGFTTLRVTEADVAGAMPDTLALLGSLLLGRSDAA